MSGGKEQITYLGDGLYGVFDGFQVELRANDPNHPTDRVYLDPATAVNAIRFIKESIRLEECPG